MRTRKRQTVLLLSIAAGASLVPACGGATTDSGHNNAGQDGSGGGGTSSVGTGGSGGVEAGLVAYPPGAGGYPVGSGGTGAYPAGSTYVPGAGGMIQGVVPYPPGTGGASPCGGHVCGVVIQPADAGVGAAIDSGPGAPASDAGATADGGGVVLGTVPVPPGLQANPGG